MVRDITNKAISLVQQGRHIGRAEQADEIERLRAIVAKLPKTKDGVPVVPGMMVWLRPGTELMVSVQDHTTTLQDWKVLHVATGGTLGIVLQGTDLSATIYAEDCHGTRKAAEAAEGGDDE